MLNKLSLNNLTDFKKNVAIIFSGSVASQAALILATPWLSRLYTPEQYGIYGLFLSIALITGTVSTFRYTQAIQITEKQEEAQRLRQVCQFSVVGVSLAMLLVLAIGYNYFISLAEELGVYIFLLPAATFFAGIIETDSVWLNRNKSFKTLAYNRIIISCISIFIMIFWAYSVDRSFKGLLIGSIAAQFIGAVFLHSSSTKFKQPNKNFSWAEIKPLLQTHKKFPIYSLPADLINVFTNQLPVLMLNRFAGKAEIGYYNMSNRILGLPSVFISTSIGEVFRQRATEDYHKYGTCRPIFLKTFKTLALVGIVPFLTIALFGPWIFSFVLGEQWRIAGDYSRVLSLMFFLRFCVSPLTYTFYIAHKQNMDFVGHIIMLLATTIPFYLGFVFFENKMIPLLIFSVAYSLFYLYNLYYSYIFSKKL